MKYDLCIVIPARNEIFLSKTIDDILSNIEGRTEVIAILDGEWTHTNLSSDKRVRYIINNESRGQRVSTNDAVKMTDAYWIMKCDAHCAFDKGFDVKMMNLMKDDYTMIPVMRNLHAFDWVCKNGHRRYQGQSGKCEECGEPTKMDVVWIAKNNPQSTAYRLDKTMHFQYWNDWGKKQKGDLTETMSIQGSCFMLTREKYWELDICSEDFNSWGQQGCEVAMKTWLSGGRVVVNRTTWYAHMFRTQGGDFGFPYENPRNKVDENRELSRKLFQNNGWNKAKYSFQWLIDKFSPPEWETSVKSQKGILFYTDNMLNIKLAKKVRKYIKNSGLPITSVSLKPLTEFGNNIHFKGERSVLTMHKQILIGLKAMKEDIVFFCEHDVIYHPSHFDFVPEKKDVFYYNENSWRVRLKDGHAVYFAHDSLSQMCCYKELAIKEFENRVKKIEKDGFNHGGYEPGTRSIAKGGFSDLTSARWRSLEPNIDIRHDNNFTPSRWSIKEFRDKNTCKDWIELNIKNLWIKEI